MSDAPIRDALRRWLPNHPQHDAFETYLTMLQTWAKVYNLTSITTPEDMVIKHVLDSLSVAPYLEGQKFIDVGTGAGLPG